MHTEDETSRFIRSCLFQTADGACYFLELHATDPMGKVSAYIEVHAIPTFEETKQGFMARKVMIRPGSLRP
jgi:hypothetical protein